MRIAFLTTLFMPAFGGAEIFLHHLVQGLSSRGHHVAVLAPAARKFRQAFQMPYPHIRTLRARSKRFLVGYPGLLSLTAAHLRHRFDLVHCQGEYHETAAAYYFNKMTGIPYVCRPIGGGFADVESRADLKKRLEKGLSKVSLVFAQGEFLRERVGVHGVADTKIITIHNGVRIDEILQFKATPPPVAPPYVLQIGGLKPVKGYDIAIQAFARVADSLPDLKLVLVGIDQRKDHFDELISRSGLEGRILFLHWCDRQTIAALICHASLYLCPFRRSPFSNANLEAMAAGVPIVATAVEGNLEQIRDDVEGYLVPQNDEAAMADRIRKILTDPSLHRRFSENAHKRARFFNWERMVDQYEEAYRRVLRRRA